MSERYCLVQSESSDWFVVPSDKRGEFLAWDLEGEGEDPNWAVYVEIDNLTFTNPELF